MKHNFDLINKYKKSFNLNGYLGKYNQISSEFIENHQDTGLICRIRDEAIKEINRMIEKRIVKKKAVDFHKINELIIVADDVAEILNQMYAYKVVQNTVFLTGREEFFINVLLENDTQKEIIKLKKHLDKIKK